MKFRVMLTESFASMEYLFAVWTSPSESLLVELLLV